MARSRLVAPLLLLSLLAVASADSYRGSYQNSENGADNHNDERKETENLVGLVYNLIHPTDQPESGAAHGKGHGYQPEQGNQYAQGVKPAGQEGHENFMQPAQYYPSHDHGIDYVVIQGNILCKSGISSYITIPGAVAKIVCPGANAYGYEYTPFSISPVANKNGYYYATYPVSKLPTSDWNEFVKGCYVIPVSSPLAICNLPSLGGSDGAYVSYSRTSGNKAYYNAGDVFFTPGNYQEYPQESTVPKTVPEETSFPVGGGY